MAECYSQCLYLTPEKCNVVAEGKVTPRSGAIALGLAVKWAAPYIYRAHCGKEQRLTSTSAGPAYTLFTPAASAKLTMNALGDQSLGSLRRVNQYLLAWRCANGLVLKRRLSYRARE